MHGVWVHQWDASLYSCIIMSNSIRHSFKRKIDINPGEIVKQTKNLTQCIGQHHPKYIGDINVKPLILWTLKIKENYLRHSKKKKKVMLYSI